MDALVIKPNFYCFIAFALWSTFACNNPASIDTSLVDQDLLDVQNESDFDISSYTLEEDSLVAYTPGAVILSKYPFGISEDPVFGTTTSSIVSQLYLTTISPPTFALASVDSVVMEIKLSEREAFYGDSTGVLGLQVFEITETLDAANTYYSSYNASTSAGIIGSYEGIPNSRDSVAITRIQADTIFRDTFPPLIRFNLSTDLGSRILNAGDDALTSPAEFLAKFQGLELRPTNTNSGLVAFDFSSFTSRAGIAGNGANVYVYYTQDGVSRQYNLNINPAISVKFPQYDQDYTGSTVSEFVGDVEKGDSLLFVQGMRGTNAVVKLNDVARLNGAIINGATLEVYGTALNGDEDIRPVPEQLVLRELDDDGDLVYIRDFSSASSAGNLSISGGEPEDIGGGIFKYSFDVGSQLQDIIEGNASEEIYIRANAKSSNMRRAVLFGAGHSTYPIKLNVTYIKL